MSRDPKDHINTRILHSGSKDQYKGIPDTMVGRILMFMWSFGALVSFGSTFEWCGSQDVGFAGPPYSLAVGLLALLPRKYME